MFIVMRYPQGKAKAVTLSYDDGVAQDIRLIDVLSKNGLKCTFNINAGLIADSDAKNGKGRLSRSQVAELYKNSGHEVASHSYTHPTLTQLPKECITSEVIRDREELEDIFETTVRGFAYPNSAYNEITTEALKACGIVYARIGDSSHSFELPDNWMILKPTCRHKDPDLFKYVDEFLNLTMKGHHTCKMFYLMGHSYEFDDDNNWDVIEEFSRKIGGRDDIWYATNIEIYDYIESYKSLRFNLKMTRVYNPTQIDVWLSKNGNITKIPAGETVDI